MNERAVVKKNIIAVFCLTAITCYGCAPESVKQLKERHAGKETFEIDKNYQEVYRNILEGARERDPGLDVNGDLYTDIRAGNVTIKVSPPSPIAVFQTIDIEALSEAKTKVTVYYAFGTWKNSPKQVKAWAEGAEK